MNRRQKIIVSITGIFLVLLILVGLTYGYFLTRIQGNTNDKSIELTTANLLVVYADGNPDVIETDNITPGEEVGTKKFTVTNNGDAETEYVVIIDNVSITDKKTEQSAEFESNDFVYTLECSSNQDGKTCEGQKEETMFPITNDGILIGNSIGVGEIQSYTLTVRYEETGKDQSNDMGKKIEARVNINNLKDVNPYKDKPETLAYNIINNAATTKTGTPLKMTPDTKPIVERLAENEKELSITSDDYGISYYYRGDVEDNYIEFAGMCWRIVRVQGDGSVKLILASEKECNADGSLSTSSGYATNGGKGSVGSVLTGLYGYRKISYYTINDYINSAEEHDKSARKQLNDWLKTKIGEEGDSNYDKLKTENWCIGDLTNAFSYSNGDIVGDVFEYSSEDTTFMYIAGVRYYVTKIPKMRCETTGADGEIDKNKIGMLTMDEVAFGGESSYLYENASTNSWWTLSPKEGSGFGRAFGLDYGGFLNGFSFKNTSDNDSRSIGLRPTITLNTGIEILHGNGTLGSPYVIE